MDSNYAPRFEEFVKTENNMWFVMEFCNGGSLAELIKAFNSNKFSIPVPVIKSLMRKITDAFSTLLSQHLL